MNAITDFLIIIFESFGLYSASNGLGDHLRGLDIKCEEGYINQSIYNVVFLCVFTINSLIVINYYRGLFNRVNFTNFLSWLINVLVGALILFFIAFLYASNDFSTGNYCEDLSITNSDCFGFGITTAIFSIVWSFILSMLIKWTSSNNKKVPF
jgi:hypothetical protein